MFMKMYALCRRPRPLHSYGLCEKTSCLQRLCSEGRSAMISCFVPTLLSPLGVCGSQLFFVGCPSVCLHWFWKCFRNALYLCLDEGGNQNKQPPIGGTSSQLNPFSCILETGSGNIFSGLLKIIAVVMIWVQSLPPQSLLKACSAQLLELTIGRWLDREVSDPIHGLIYCQTYHLKELSESDRNFESREWIMSWRMSL